MIAVRHLLTLLRVLGVLTLALILYAWVYPARLGQWMSGGAEAGGAAVAEGAGGDAGFVLRHAGPTVPANVPMPSYVSRPQAAVAQWLGSKYHVVPEAIEMLVVEADKLSKSYHLSPNLIIAIMAIESNFHPYIQSGAGAQGLMQVMPAIHAKRYERFGGKSSFVDPIVSLNVGAEILRDCVKLKGGSEAEALRYYFGGGAASDAYIDKVRAEQHRLNQVAAGAHVAFD